MSSPIRVGIIGLTAATSGTTAWAANAHLPYLKQSPHYTIVALCNSSIEAAQRAIEKYDLPAETKAYGSPEDLAADPNVDLVVVSTRVDRHALVALPSLKKGKHVFTEWPMDRNLAVAKDMLAASQEGGGRTFVGIQAPMAPAIRTLQGLIADGKIGRVLSSTFVASVDMAGYDQDRELGYMLDREIGGNLLTIAFGHSESIQDVSNKTLY
jgi:predicted dehydrogenase